MPSIAHQAEQVARRLLDEDPGGLRSAEWTVEAVGLLLDDEELDVDHDLVVAAAWATATIGARSWLDPGDGYGIDDVRRDLGVGVARIVEWLVMPDWQGHQEHLDDLLQHGPVEAQVVALGQAMVRVVQVGDDVSEDQLKAPLRLAIVVMPVRALAGARASR